jgi:hypothetical protein
MTDAWERGKTRAGMQREVRCNDLLERDLSSPVLSEFEGKEPD